jgi:hypothetical protein
MAVYTIKKTMDQPNGKRVHVFLNNGHSEVWETKSEKHAIEFAELLNENSDSGHSYMVIPIGKLK